MLIEVKPPLDDAELCRIIFGGCVLWVCPGCWERNKEIIICPVSNRRCKYAKPVKDDKHGLIMNCNCKELLSIRQELVTAIQLLGYVK